MTITRRSWRAPALALGVACLWPALAASQAHALTSVVCNGSETGTFSPSLTNTPASTTINFQQNYSCLSLTNPSITSGTYSNTLTIPATCALLTSGASRSRTITWNTGETSTFTFTSTVVPVAGVLSVTRTGTITAGKFNGATAVEDLIGFAALDDCDSTGVSAYSGTSVLTLT